MMRVASCLLAFAALAFSQTPAQMPAEEQEHLRQVLQDGSSSTVDLIRALESHLAKYPNSPRRAELERALAKASIEAKDDRRIVLYGERVLAKDPDDFTTLDRTIRSLLTFRDPESMKKALKYAKHYEASLRVLAGKPVESGAARAKRKEEVDRALARALISQAIATGNLGDPAAAAMLARRSFEAFPAADAAVELGRRLVQLGKVDEAIRAYADAFTVADPQASEADRAAIRRVLGELYQKAKGSEAGLGDIVLQAYDRNAAITVDRRIALQQFDPNIGATNPMQFTLTSVSGDKLPMSSLLGKAVVLDFWATWCGPCRSQHPLYEEVKKRFAGRDDVVFLAISTDEDRAAVKPFLEAQGWSNQAYFEDGLSRALRVTSIPTTVVFNRAGAVVSRMNGFDPEKFVEMLTGRIEDALVSGRQ
jgi:thiol-disulfide isomerase/thioredoxin